MSVPNLNLLCQICPRRCGVNRAAGELGYCKAGALPKVYNYHAHHGEEPPISGTRGSGTIFFSSCNMRCRYCQNYIFSQLHEGAEIPVKKLSDIMLSLQQDRCHNINLVTPTHFVPQIMDAIALARQNGLAIPIVYNTSGYESVDTLRKLEGIVDIYLADMRYGRNTEAERYSGAPDYVEVNQAAVLEMQRQVGLLNIDSYGIARRGLMIRHLVLPNGLAGTREVLSFIASKVSCETYISFMSQYYPTYQAPGIPEISRGITPGEYGEAKHWLEHFGLHRGWVQGKPDSRFAGIHFKPNL